MRRISKLNLKNFKFFYGDQVVDFERKNVLLYGENGSGKSTIYWALYTFLQSVFKTDDEQIKKYFDPGHDQNLVNRFMPANEHSSIVVEFQEDDQSTNVKTISFTTINTKGEAFVKEASTTSDFINYRILSSVYAFRNRDSVDLFQVFEEDILMFMTFGSEVSPGKRTAADWWEYLEPGMKPRTRMSDPAYHDFQAKVLAFNTEFNNYLNRIIQTANEYLQQEFKQSLKLKIKYEHCSYDDFIDGSTTKRNHLTKRPKIILTVDYAHVKLLNGKEIINRPHSFLNEARLTSIALSIRLAILDEKYISSAPKILVLDDLLISLDMSNRDIVLDLVLKKFQEYQIFILSHDRMFFELAKHKIKSSPHDNWKFIEMYEQYINDIPQPFITQSDSYLEKAKKFFIKKEYEVAGNFLRKEAEAFCKDFLPRRKQFTPDYTLFDLNGLIHQCLQYATENGLNLLPFQELDSHRKFVLNSTSHDSYDVPKFNSEITKCIETIEKLREIRQELVFNKGDRVSFELISADGSTTYKFEITFQEELRLLKEAGVESILPRSMINYNVFANDVKTQPDTQHATVGLKKMYDDCYAKSDKAKSADFWEEIVISNTGAKLKTARVF